MFSNHNLQELADFSASDAVLSVYLNTDPSTGNADAYRLKLRTMLKEAKLSQDMAPSAAAVERYFHQDYNWQGKGVAVFSCAAKNFFKVFTLALPVESRVSVSDHPLINPLANLLDVYGNYGVVLIDQQGALLFYVHLGELAAQEGTLGELVKRTKHGGSSTVAGRRGGTAGMTRAVEETVDKNMKESADFAVHFFEKKHVRRILIGGTEDNIASFRSELPKAWQSLVMGTFPMAMSASQSEVLSKALEVGQETEKQHERHLVKNMIDSAAGGGTAITGIKGTLNALNDGRVQTLLVSETYQQPGFQCCSDEKLSMDEKCPECGGEMVFVPNIVELAVISALRHKGSVEVVHANREMEQAGHIGAILRY